MILPGWQGKKVDLTTNGRSELAGGGLRSGGTNRVTLISIGKHGALVLPEPYPMRKQNLTWIPIRNIVCAELVEADPGEAMF